MLLIPAVDIKDGQCVRLRRGETSEVSVYSSDPLAMARFWADQGCRRLHVVDLDGAFEGAPVNHSLMGRICRELSDVAVQVGGGIRGREALDALFDAGASEVVLGTQAIEDREFLNEATEVAAGKCFLGLDTRDGKIAVRGWTQTLNLDLDDFVLEVRNLPLAGFVHTDISRDGMMMGVGDGLAASVRLAELSAKPVVVSGGVTGLDDLERIRTAASSSAGNILGVISGRALYEQSFEFSEGQSILTRGT